MNIALRNAIDISNLIKDRRHQLGLTQADLAAQAGVARRWLAGIEACEGGTHIDKILATFDVLGVTISAASTDGGSESELSEVIRRHTS